MIAGQIRKSLAATALAAALLGGFVLAPAAAEARGYWHGGYWHGGYWHGGYWGGGIVVGTPYWYGWGPRPWYDPYYYAPPVYAAPSVIVTQPAPVIVAPAPAVAPPAVPSYYYCDNPAGYYPHVAVCSVPFRAVAIPQR